MDRSQLPNRRFCEGSPNCATCGAPHQEGVWQACPCPLGTRSATVAEPSLARKAVSLCASVARWKMAGSPVRTQERVNEILAICQACPHLLGAGTERQRCGVCGCPVSDRIDKPTKNKLAMKTEACPLEPPKWAPD